MGRRIRWLGVIMVACLGLVVAQLVNIQLVKGKQLQASPFNPRVSSLQYINPRGTISAADGTVLAQSVPTPPGTTKDYLYHYVRQYPQGPLYGGITGYWGAVLPGHRDRAAVRRRPVIASEAPADVEPAALPPTATVDHRQRLAERGTPTPERGLAGPDDTATGRQQGRGGRGDPAVDRERPGHGVEPHLRPQRADEHVVQS